ncbi:MAG: energy-coupled thiamine transporter ThiT [bacterium]|nr:energy-coupled thiamine transporter ThiT [bacterium]MCM1376541.1 energy-coupled thiamine transporter ThiT [Muribaculum sp.]
MLYDVVVDEWGGTTYVPTTLGNALLLALVIALLGGAVAAARIRARKASAASGPMRGKGKLTARQLAFCAMAIALGTVLSKLKLFEFPTGGSVSLFSMLPVCLPGYFFGLGAGLLTGIAYGVLQLLLDPYVLFPAQLVVDYLLAFGALGLSGLFCNAKNGLLKGYLAAVCGRYVFAVLSGWLFFGAYAWEGWAPLPYSLAYNAIYIFTEAALTVIILLLPPVKRAMGSVRKMTLE